MYLLELDLEYPFSGKRVLAASTVLYSTYDSALALLFTIASRSHVGAGVVGGAHIPPM
jgi:hypothetical protein